MHIKINIDTEKLERIAKRTPELFKKIIKQAGLGIEAKAVKLISIGGELQAEAEGNLKGSIYSRTSQEGGSMMTYVGATAGYASWVHDGTGIYGPLKQPIVPVNKKVLAFSIGGKQIFARSVKGMKSHPFLTKALQWFMDNKFVKLVRDIAGEDISKK